MKIFHGDPKTAGSPSQNLGFVTPTHPGLTAMITSATCTNFAKAHNVENAGRQRIFCFPDVAFVLINSIDMKTIGFHGRRLLSNDVQLLL